MLQPFLLKPLLVVGCVADFCCLVAIPGIAREGGLRVPAFVRWSGHIEPGKRSLDLVSTMDIFPTIMQIAGVSLPDDRIIDGEDLSPLLLGKDDPLRGDDPRRVSQHGDSEDRCLFFYQGSSEDPSNSSNLVTEDDFAGPGQTGLFAVRCGPYKVHFYTRTAWGPNSAGWAQQLPPLVYQVEHDPGEAYPLDNSTTEYSQILTTISAATVEHQTTLSSVPNQVGESASPTTTLHESSFSPFPNPDLQYVLGDDTALCPCADPESRKKYPEYPNCTLTPETWTPFGASLAPEAYPEATQRAVEEQPSH